MSNSDINFFAYSFSFLFVKSHFSKWSKKQSISIQKQQANYKNFIFSHFSFSRFYTLSALAPLRPFFIFNNLCKFKEIKEAKGAK